MRICLVYDCLYPFTVGGAERWYRNLGERLAAEGHQVTMLTLRQWPRGEHPDLGAVRVVEAGPPRLLARVPGGAGRHGGMGGPAPLRAGAPGGFRLLPPARAASAGGGA